MKYKVMAAILTIGILFGSGIVWAEGKYKTIEVFLDRINLSLNGQVLPMNKDSIIYNGSVYIPLRDLSTILGAEVAWNDASRTVSLDFIKNQSNEAFQAGQVAMYQYITISNNRILSQIIDDFKNNRMDQMKEHISGFDGLNSIAVGLNDTSLTQLFEKIKVSAELIRSGWISKKLDDYYLAWNIFSANQLSLNTYLKAKISDPVSATTP